MHTLSVYRRADLAHIPPRITALNLYMGDAEVVGADDVALLPTGLKVLRVQSITHDALDALAKRLGALTHLELYVDRLGLSALDALAALPDLAHVSLHSAREDLPSIAALKRLTSMSLSCKSGAAITRQLDGFTALTTLTISGVQRLTGADLAVVAKLPALTRLDLSGIASREPDALVALKGCDALTTLERLRLDPHVSDLCGRPGGLQSLAGAPALWHLEVGQYSQGWLDEATEAAMRAIPNLLLLAGVLAPGALAGQALVTNQFGWYPETNPSEFELAWA